MQTFRHTERRMTQLQQEWGALEKQAQSAGVEIATGDEFALQRQGVHAACSVAPALSPAC